MNGSPPPVALRSHASAGPRRSGACRTGPGPGRRQRPRALPAHGAGRSRSAREGQASPEPTISRHDDRREGHGAVATTFRTASCRDAPRRTRFVAGRELMGASWGMPLGRHEKRPQDSRRSVTFGVRLRVLARDVGDLGAAGAVAVSLRSRDASWRRVRQESGSEPGRPAPDGRRCTGVVSPRTSVPGYIDRRARRLAESPRHPWVRRRAMVRPYRSTTTGSRRPALRVTGRHGRSRIGAPASGSEISVSVVSRAGIEPATH